MCNMRTRCHRQRVFCTGEKGKLQFVGLLAAAGGLGPLVLRGLAKIGTSKPIFDWGSFLF